MTQPEALRLADMLENNYPLEPEAEEAAAGLRRLHEENERLRQALAQPEQEPVLWMMPDGKNVDKWGLQFYGGVIGKPLYTAPPKREWVGLTDEELKVLCDEWQIIYGGYVRPFARAVEAKLKEKNA